MRKVLVNVVDATNVNTTVHKLQVSIPVTVNRLQRRSK